MHVKQQHLVRVVRANRSSRTDGKHPDSLALALWQVGKNLVWDVTVAGTLVNSYLTSM